MRIRYHVMSAPAPLGLLFLAATDQGLRHVEYMDRRSLKRTIATHAAAAPGSVWEMSLHDLRPLADQLTEWFHGTRRALDWPLDPPGDDAARALVLELARTPYGTTRTLADLARALGRPRDTAAIAEALAHNPIAIVAPCHRITGPKGEAIESVGGAARRAWLVESERRFGKLGGLDDNRVIGELVKRVSATAAPVATAKRTVAARATKKGATTPRQRSKVGVVVSASRRTAAPSTRPKAARAAAPVKGATTKRSR
ncbi:MAG: methylated-DNA--[protein]-cysteine S-methyltransferase [bacterium]